MKVYTVVTMLSGVIDEVRTFADEAMAEGACVGEMNEIFGKFEDYPEDGTFEEKYEWMTGVENDTEVRLYETEVE